MRRELANDRKVREGDKSSKINHPVIKKKFQKYFFLWSSISHGCSSTVITWLLMSLLLRSCYGIASVLSRSQLLHTDTEVLTVTLDVDEMRWLFNFSGTLNIAKKLFSLLVFVFVLWYCWRTHIHQNENVYKTSTNNILIKSSMCHTDRLNMRASDLFTFLRQQLKKEGNADFCETLYDTTLHA